MFQKILAILPEPSWMASWLDLLDDTHVILMLALFYRDMPEFVGALVLTVEIPHGCPDTLVGGVMRGRLDPVPVHGEALEILQILNCRLEVESLVLHFSQENVRFYRDCAVSGDLHVGCKGGQEYLQTGPA